MHANFQNLDKGFKKQEVYKKQLYILICIAMPRKAGNHYRYLSIV